MLSKSATVHTNDPEHSKIVLHLKGRVEKVVTIVPWRVRLVGTVGEKITQAVTITPETMKPFNIVKVSAIKGVDFRYKLEEKDRFDKKVYVLTVTNTRKKPGRYFDSISLKTDDKSIGSFSITVMGYLKPAPESDSQGK